MPMEPEALRRIIEIHRKNVPAKGRHCWPLADGSSGTVEEVAREYYLTERGFSHGLLDAACVYGGLLWVFFCDILFHDNLDAKQPLRTLFFHTPARGYDRYKTEIEDRLALVRKDRVALFEEWFPRFVNHKLFCDPASNICAYFGSWARRNEAGLRQFVESAPEHNLDGLVREILLDSEKGKSAGWPDLVLWNEESLLFAEVKWRDAVSEAQKKWIRAHEKQHTVEIVRVSSILSDT